MVQQGRLLLEDLEMLEELLAMMQVLLFMQP
jgi:hypothetical protein